MVTSPLQLSYVPPLRDCAKAPFLLALVLLMGIARILNAPFSPTLARAPGWVHSPFVNRVYDRRAAALERAGVWRT